MFTPHFSNLRIPFPAWAAFMSLGLATAPAFAADAWFDVTSPLLKRLENEGLKSAWPGGCSGVVVHRNTGALTVKVVGLGLWQSCLRAQPPGAH